ncbi:Uncharacterised protein [Mycobacteroides abscessus subsp. abscessus]|nr:Uncharacterised protein [Mycobacteroides abscessus subsp. abscessus]
MKIKGRKILKELKLDDSLHLKSRLQMVDIPAERLGDQHIPAAGNHILFLEFSIYFHKTVPLQDAVCIKSDDDVIPAEVDSRI